MKKALQSADVMGFPLNDWGGFIFDVETSGVEISEILHQFQRDRERLLPLPVGQ